MNKICIDSDKNNKKYSIMKNHVCFPKWSEMNMKKLKRNETIWVRVMIN